MQGEIFSAQFIAQLPADTMLALERVCVRFFDIREAIRDDSVNDIDLEGFGFLQAFMESRKFRSSAFTVPAKPPSDISLIFKNIYVVAAEYARVHQFEKAKEQYSLMLSSRFGYEFTDGDLAAIQTCINQLRDAIAKNSEIEEEHRTRLLKRLEELQRELHKKVGSLDRFYGLLVEANVLLQKVGKSMIPIVVIVKRITDIVWATQARTEELPSGTKFELPAEETLQLPEHGRDVIA